VKVVLIYRQRRLGTFSIEGLFHTIADELRKEIEVIEYEVSGRQAVLRDALNLRKLDADVYHITGDINYLILLLPRHKTVLTVHDIGHYLFGLSGIKRWIYKWLWLVLPIRWAATVTTVSKATTDNIVEYLDFDSKRLVTIDNCYSPLFRYKLRDFNLDCPVILQVGTKPYKNVPRLVSALKGIPCKLLLIGEIDEPIRNQLDVCETDYENRTNLTHEEIVQAYNDCDLVTFISIGEGFGVPIIEAQACGRPLVTADIPPMSDVAGPASCQVSPFDESEIRSAILRIINDEAYRVGVVKAGLQNAEKYSPQSIAKQYCTIYKRISNGPKNC
jgi:glycosyltransferase involved in cell wall biosynthesis